MKCNNWIVEIDGRKYAIDRTFDASPAIYVNDGKFSMCNRTHIKGFPTGEHEVIIVAHTISEQE